MFHTLPHKMPKPVTVTLTQPVYGSRDQFIGNRTTVEGRFTTREEAYQFIDQQFGDLYDSDWTVQVLPRLEWVKTTEEWEDIPF